MQGDGDLRCYMLHKYLSDGWVQQVAKASKALLENRWMVSLTHNGIRSLGKMAIDGFYLTMDRDWGLCGQEMASLDTVYSLLTLFL